MFDRITQPRGGTGRRGAFLAVAAAAHAGLVALALYVSARAATSGEPPVEVTLFRPAPPAPRAPGPPPPPPPTRRKAVPSPPGAEPVPARPVEIVAPREVPPPAPPEPPAPEMDGEGEEGGEAGGVPGGVAGGEEGGALGGAVGGSGSAAPPPAELPPIYLKAGMVKPTLPARCVPRVPDALKGARLSGTVLVRFVLGTDGRVREVTFLQSVPGLDGLVREALLGCQMAPVLYDGEPVSVYVIQSFRFESN